MEVSSFSHLLSISAPQQPGEFEFHMNSSLSIDTKELTTSPADELFYKGNLLPLHLPPRLQMVEKLLLFRSFFGKSGCSDDSTKVADLGTISKAKECEKPPPPPPQQQKKAPFGQIQKEKVIQIPNLSAEDGNGRLHRRSFSMALRRNSTNKSSACSSTSSSSSSSSASSNGFYGLPFLKRSSSVNSEVENPIQGAIAHCKQSQKGGEIGFSATKIAICEEEELCRG